MRILRTIIGLGVVFVIALLVLLAVNFDTAKSWTALHTGTHYLPCGKGDPTPVCPNQIYYNFWSGFGSDLGEATLITAVVGGAYGAYRKANCRTKGCPRIAHHDLVVKHGEDDPGTTIRVCSHCHPHVKGQKFERHELHKMHLRHRKENMGDTDAGTS